VKLNELLQTDHERNMVISFRTIRKAVGWLGIALPPAVYIGTLLIGHCATLKPSISDYYYTIMGCVLVGVLCAVALFMFTYKGPARIDEILSSLAGLFALGIAFFPCNVSGGHYDCNIICRPFDTFRNDLHYGSAAGFFAVTTIMAIWLFRKTDKKDPGLQKEKRNTVYLVCGIIMIVSTLGILAMKVFNLGEKLYAYRPVYFLELIALWAFGIAWLVKGELVLKDKKTTSPSK
jgi:hypothetical protein